MLFIYSGVCWTQTPHPLVCVRYPYISVPPPLLIWEILGGCDGVSLEMCLATEMGWTQRCTWKPGSSEFDDAGRDEDWVNSKMHFRAGIKRHWRCTGRLRLSEHQNALGGRDWASWKMHLESIMEQFWICTWKPRFSGLRDARGVRNWACLEIYLEVMSNQNCRSTCRKQIGREVWPELTLNLFVH